MVQSAPGLRNSRSIRLFSALSPDSLLARLLILETEPDDVSKPENRTIQTSAVDRVAIA